MTDWQKAGTVFVAVAVGVGVGVGVRVPVAVAAGGTVAVGLGAGPPEVGVAVAGGGAIDVGVKVDAIAVGVNEGTIGVEEGVAAGAVGEEVGVNATQLPVMAQASQQLASAPSQAVPPEGALHWPTRLMLHVFLPVLVVRQQVARPVRPQVDLRAHFITAPRHAVDNDVLCTTPLTHWR